MSRIYLVKTPSGERLVDSATRSQAINHCVSTDYSAEPISASDLHAYLLAGATVEKVEAKGKKSEAGALPGPNVLTQPQATTPSAVSLASTPAPLAGGNPTPYQPAPQSSPSSAPNQGIATNLANIVGAGTAAAAPQPSQISSPQPTTDSNAPAGGWLPPGSKEPIAIHNAQTSIGAVNPVLAEQQRINPDAAAAAGAPAPQPAPAPIIPINPNLQQAPAGWQDRTKAQG